MTKMILGLVTILVIMLLFLIGWDNQDNLISNYLTLQFERIQLLFDLLITVGLIYLIFLK